MGVPEFSHHFGGAAGSVERAPVVDQQRWRQDLECGHNSGTVTTSLLPREREACPERTGLPVRRRVGRHARAARPAQLAKWLVTLL